MKNSNWGQTISSNKSHAVKPTICFTVIDQNDSKSQHKITLLLKLLILMVKLAGSQVSRAV